MISLKAACWCLIAVATFGSANRVDAQSLAAVADRTREARSGAPETARRYTNRDLPAIRRAPDATPTSPAPVQTSETKTSSHASTALPNRTGPAAAAPPVDAPVTEAEKVRRDLIETASVRDLDARLARLRADAEMLEARLRQINTAVTGPPSSATALAFERDKQEISPALSRIRADIAALAAARARIGQQAR